MTAAELPQWTMAKHSQLQPNTRASISRTADGLISFQLDGSRAFSLCSLGRRVNESARAASSGAEVEPSFVISTLVVPPSGPPVAPAAYVSSNGECLRGKASIAVVERV